MEPKQVKDLIEAYASIYSTISESHFKVGDEVICKASGMEGEVIKVDPEGKGKYYTVKHEDGKTMKYASDELKLEKEEEKEKEEKKVEEGYISEDPVQDYRDMKREKENAAGMRGSELSHSTKPSGGSAKQKPQKPQPRSREFSHGGSSQPRSREFAREEVETDLFDYLLEYLVAEGYADTNKAALAIMANMSEEWKQSIVEADSVEAMRARAAKRRAQRYGKQGGGGRDDFRPYTEDDYKKPGSGAASQAKDA